ncbi:hypothetical protein [Oscillospiraceae bacterium]|nr:hypothetical protein [Oscillospiraceae bacterium]
MVSAGFFVVEKARILQNSPEFCKIRVFSVLSEFIRKKTAHFYKQENQKQSQYRQKPCRAVILPPVRAPPFLTFAYPCK